jgi:hypothetical protein
MRCRFNISFMEKTYLEAYYERRQEVEDDFIKLMNDIHFEYPQAEIYHQPTSDNPNRKISFVCVFNEEQIVEILFNEVPYALKCHGISTMINYNCIMFSIQDIMNNMTHISKFYRSSKKDFLEHHSHLIKFNPMKTKKKKTVKTLQHVEFTKKEFLAPESIRSMAVIHTKIKKNGEASVRISDCNQSIKLWNDLNNPEEVHEMILKLNTLILNLREFKREVGLKLPGNAASLKSFHNE